MNFITQAGRPPESPGLELSEDEPVAVQITVTSSVESSSTFWPVRAWRSMKAALAARDAFKAKLDTWALTQPNQDHAKQAVDEIYKCYGDAYSIFSPSNSLRLVDLHITSLPDCVGELQSVTSICLSGCRRIKKLPESISNLQNLTRLRVMDRTRLEALPQSIGECSALTHLGIEGSDQMTKLPTEIGRLSNLESFEITAKNLTELPRSMEKLENLKELSIRSSQSPSLANSIPNLPNLRKLTTSGNYFTSLPPSITRLQSLTHLNLSYNSLLENIDGIENLSNLETLYLESTDVTSIPDEIKELTNLKSFIFMSMNIAIFPQAVFALPDTCEVRMHKVPRWVMDRTAQDSYRGPKIRPNNVDEEATNPLDDVLKSLANAAGCDKPIHFVARSGEEASRLIGWINNLTKVKGYEQKTALANQIIQYLEQAEIDPDFRKIFFETVKEATKTCGDRMALSILHVGIAYDLSRLGLDDPIAVAAYLKGVWALNLLEDIARAKIAELKGLDSTFDEEIEVYLAYPVMLKNELNLPIHIDDMLFFGCARLNQKDLATAKASVEELMGSDEGYHKFLIHQDKWRSVLENLYPDEFDAILEGEGDMEAQMIELTKKALA